MTSATTPSALADEITYGGSVMLPRAGRSTRVPAGVCHSSTWTFSSRSLRAVICSSNSSVSAPSGLA
ncbi:Uncharacterised protein [Mycobacteroides abscessus subsp. abscessus]|nr:Uncharacterised protein [Mycobacteroides abscessus subsp. abscessus]